MRLFVAVNFNDEIKDSLCRAIDALRGASFKGSFSRRENLHLTLVFLGEVRPNDVMEITKCIDLIDCEPFTLRVGGIGRFARHGGDICWAGVKPDKNLKELQKMISEGLENAGFSFDRREYHPHLTLGREVLIKQSSRQSEELRKADAAAKWYEDPQNQRLVPDMAMEVKKVSLMQSERIGGRMVYSEIYVKNLR